MENIGENEHGRDCALYGIMGDFWWRSFEISRMCIYVYFELKVSDKGRRLEKNEHYLA